MKKVLSLFMVLFLINPLITFAETRWQDAVIPGDDIKNAKVIIRLEKENSRWYTVGIDMPEGLYRITPGYLQSIPAHDQYVIAILRGADKIAQSEFLDTEKDTNFAFYLRNGDSVYISIGFSVLYLSSVENRFVQIVPAAEDVP